MARTYRFADGFDEPDVVAFGLPAPQLMTVVAAAVVAYLILRLTLPGVLTVPMAVAVAGAGALLGWGRWLDRPLLAWAVAGGRFAIAPKQRHFIVLSEAVDDPAAAPGAGSASPFPPETDAEADLAGQPWARWLRHPGGEPGAGSRHEPPAVPAAAAPAARTETPCAGGAAETGNGLGRSPGGWFEPGGQEPEPGHAEAPRLAVLTDPAGAPADDADEESDEDEAVILPFARAFADEADDGEVELSGAPVGGAQTMPSTPPAAGAPVFVGATRRVTFFSLNGGTGTTTLATETAGLLAARGQHSRDGVTQERLKVALIDLDLRSATVSVRLGIPHPTIWDFVIDEKALAENVDDYLVVHRSGLRALLGPPKPIAAGRGIEPARIAEIVHQLESEGYHFIFFDIAADFDAVSTWVLGAVHDVFVVITPTASGVQDAYRTTEALRRMGLRHKLSYVVNRARPGYDVREVMTDLGGTLRASIPYDPAIEQAENEHRLAALGASPGAAAIASLAAHLYPPLQVTAPRRRLQLPWRRRAG